SCSRCRSARSARASRSGSRRSRSRSRSWSAPASAGCSCEGGSGVNREAQSVLLLLVGGAVLRISVSDIYLRYVKEGLGPFLIVAGALLVAIAVATLLRELFKTEHHDHDHEEDDGHGHGAHGTRIAWMLVLPVFATFLIAPPAVGSFS